MKKFGGILTTIVIGNTLRLVIYSFFHWTICLVFFTPTKHCLYMVFLRLSGARFCCYRYAMAFFSLFKLIIWCYFSSVIPFHFIFVVLSLLFKMKKENFLLYSFFLYVFVVVNVVLSLNLNAEKNENQKRWKRKVFLNRLHCTCLFLVCICIYLYICVAIVYATIICFDLGGRGVWSKYNMAHWNQYSIHTHIHDIKREKKRR